MIERYKNTFNAQNYDEKLERISFEYGIIKNNKSVYKSTSHINSDYLERTIKDTIIKLEKNNEHVKLMGFMDKSTSSIQLLGFDVPMNSPVTKDSISVQFSEMEHDRGDKIYILVTYTSVKGDKNKYIFTYAKQYIDIIKNKRIQLMGDNAKTIQMDNALLICPSMLVSIHDVNQNLLVIRNVERAEVYHNLSDFFEKKARAILSETVRNHEKIKLSKKSINSILKNEKYFRRDFINKHMETFRDTLNKMDLSILELDDEIMIEPSIIFTEKAEIETYVELMSQYLYRHRIENSEDERVIKNV